MNARMSVPGVSLLLSALLKIPTILTTNGTRFQPGTGALAAANPSIDAARRDVIYFGLWGRAEAGRGALRGALEGSPTAARRSYPRDVATQRCLHTGDPAVLENY